MGEIGLDLVALEAGGMVPHDEALAEGLMHRHRQPPPELGEADEDQAHAVLGVHGEVGQQAEILHHVAAQMVSLVDDEDGELPGFLGEVGDLTPDRVMGRGAGPLDGQPEFPSDGLVKWRARCRW